MPSSKQPRDEEVILRNAIVHHQGGDLEVAQGLYETILRKHPMHADALHLLGMLLHQRGDDENALAFIDKSISTNVNVANFHASRALVLDALGMPAEAIDSFKHAILLQPDNAATRYNLGNTLQREGALQQAIGCFLQTLEIEPGYADARINLGNTYQMQGNFQLASQCFAEALERNPGDAAAAFNLSNVFKLQGKLDQAEAALKRVLALNPQHVDALNNLGNLLQDQARIAESVQIYQRAIALAPKRADLYNNMGNAFKALSRLEQAADAFSQAIEIQPTFAQAHNNLGNVYKDQARMVDALACYEAALALAPRLPDIASNQTLTAQYTQDYTPEELFELHKQFAKTFEAPLVPTWPSHKRQAGLVRDKNRLKVGYVSADFCNHPVANFITPVIENHDRAQVEVYCYYNSLKNDAVTAILKKLADHWINCHGLTDEHLAQRITADCIDILVDLAGHSAAGRLLVFARKPAPVQVTYLGYIATTGLTAMDYRLTQGDVDPPGNERFYTEKLYRLPGDLWWVYRPPKAVPEPGPLPALTNGFITFGSTNNVGKLSPGVIATWSEILRRNATAKLLIAGLADGVGRHRLCEQFAAHGVANERLMQYGRLPANQYFELHQKIDIALDPFPYNGGTTTCDSLWMGLPPIALKGDAFVSRMGWGLLKSLGLPELVAESVDDYVETACALAGNVTKLSRLRACLRDRVAASALCDEAGFTRKLESAYREMWQTWSTGQAPQPNKNVASEPNKTNTIPMKKFLHVGCGPQTKARTTRAFNTPEWTELRLDIDPTVKPDIVGTMLDMSAVPDASVDAIFSSHNIEHLYPHEVPLALAEFKRVLKPDGYAVITCPDLKSICALVADDKLTQTAYTSPSGPITPLDMLYGHRPPMAKGNLYMSHRCGFTEKVLSGTLRANGFPVVASIQRAERFDLWAVAAVSAMDEGKLRVIAESHIPR